MVSLIILICNHPTFSTYFVTMAGLLSSMSWSFTHELIVLSWRTALQPCTALNLNSSMARVSLIYL